MTDLFSNINSIPENYNLQVLHNSQNCSPEYVKIETHKLIKTLQHCVEMLDTQANLIMKRRIQKNSSHLIKRFNKIQNMKKNIIKAIIKEDDSAAYLDQLKRLYADVINQLPSISLNKKRVYNKEKFY